MYLNQALLRQPLPRVPARNLEPGDVFLADNEPAEVRSAHPAATTGLADDDSAGKISITATDRRRGSRSFTQPPEATLVILPRSWRTSARIPETAQASRAAVEQAHREVEGRALSAQCQLMPRDEHARCAGWVTPFDGFTAPCGCTCGCYARRQAPTND